MTSFSFSFCSVSFFSVTNNLGAKKIKKMHGQTCSFRLSDRHCQENIFTVPGNNTKKCMWKLAKYMIEHPKMGFTNEIILKFVNEFLEVSPPLNMSQIHSKTIGYIVDKKISRQILKSN